MHITENVAERIPEAQIYEQSTETFRTTARLSPLRSKQHEVGEPHVPRELNFPRPSKSKQPSLNKTTAPIVLRHTNLAGAGILILATTLPERLPPSSQTSSWTESGADLSRTASCSCRSAASCWESGCDRERLTSRDPSRVRTERWHRDTACRRCCSGLMGRRAGQGQGQGQGQGRVRGGEGLRKVRVREGQGQGQGLKGYTEKHTRTGRRAE